MARMHQKAGFTIIETSLATLFLGIIVLAVANLIVQMTQIYQKGLALRAINASGQQIIEDMQRQINSATYLYDIDTDGNGLITNQEIIDGKKFYFREWNENSNSQKQIAGSFCIGSYSYVWNTALPLADASGRSGVIIKTPATSQVYKLARVYDPSHRACNDAFWKPASGQFATGKNFTLDYSDISDMEEPVELINRDETDLAVYDFTAHPITQSSVTKQSFVSASFILATIRGGVNIMSSGDYCQGDAAKTGDANDYDDYDFDYCAVNKFNFSMRTGGNADKNG